MSSIFYPVLEIVGLNLLVCVSTNQPYNYQYLIVNRLSDQRLRYRLNTLCEMHRPFSSHSDKICPFQTLTRMLQIK